MGVRAKSGGFVLRSQHKDLLYYNEDSFRPDCPDRLVFHPVGQEWHLSCTTLTEFDFAGRRGPSFFSDCLVFEKKPNVRDVLSSWNSLEWVRNDGEYEKEIESPAAIPKGVASNTAGIAINDNLLSAIIWSLEVVLFGDAQKVFYIMPQHCFVEIMGALHSLLPENAFPYSFSTCESLPNRAQTFFNCYHETTDQIRKFQTKASSETRNFFWNDKEDHTRIPDDHFQDLYNRLSCVFEFPQIFDELQFVLSFFQPTDGAQGYSEFIKSLLEGPLTELNRPIFCKFCEDLAAQQQKERRIRYARCFPGFLKHSLSIYLESPCRRDIISFDCVDPENLLVRLTELLTDEDSDYLVPYLECVAEKRNDPNASPPWDISTSGKLLSNHPENLLVKLLDSHEFPPGFAQRFIYPLFPSERCLDIICRGENFTMEDQNYFSQVEGHSLLAFAKTLTHTNRVQFSFFLLASHKTPSICDLQLDTLRKLAPAELGRLCDHLDRKESSEAFHNILLSNADLRSRFTKNRSLKFVLESCPIHMRKRWVKEFLEQYDYHTLSEHLHDFQLPVGGMLEDLPLVRVICSSTSQIVREDIITLAHLKPTGLGAYLAQQWAEEIHNDQKPDASNILSLPVKMVVEDFLRAVGKDKKLCRKLYGKKHQESLLVLLMCCSQHLDIYRGSFLQKKMTSKRFDSLLASSFLEISDPLQPNPKAQGMTHDLLEPRRMLLKLRPPKRNFLPKIW